jgi:hypothetical protein
VQPRRGNGCSDQICFCCPQAVNFPAIETRVCHTNDLNTCSNGSYTLLPCGSEMHHSRTFKARPAGESESQWSVGWSASLYLLQGGACISILGSRGQLSRARAGNFPQLASSDLSKHFYDYLTLKPLSPDLVEMSECSTPDTDAAEGPLFRCWTNCWMASSLPCASPWTCAESVLA